MILLIATDTIGASLIAIIYQTNHTIANKCKPPLATLLGKLLLATC